MIARSISGRIARLERYRRPRSSYVLHLSTPPLPEELAAIEKAKIEGRRFAVLPHTCASAEEWLATHAPREVLQ
jgi:hypothetical protein